MTERDPRRTLDQPHPSRFASTDPGYDAAIRAHHDALERGDAGYTDPQSGNFVFTAAYLAERDCCDCGCRHCPYVSTQRYELVPGLPIRNYRAVVTLSATDAGGTDITWESRFEGRVAGPGGLMRVLLGRFIRDTAPRLATAASVSTTTRQQP